MKTGGNLRRLRQFRSTVPLTESTGGSGHGPDGRATATSRFNNILRIGCNSARICSLAGYDSSKLVQRGLSVNTAKCGSSFANAHPVRGDGDPNGRCTGHSGSAYTVPRVPGGAGDGYREARRRRELVVQRERHETLALTTSTDSTFRRRARQEDNSTRREVLRPKRSRGRRSATTPPASTTTSTSMSSPGERSRAGLAWLEPVFRLCTQFAVHGHHDEES